MREPLPLRGVGVSRGQSLSLQQFLDLAGAVADALLQFGGGLGRGTAEPMLCLPFLALDPTSSENQ